MATTSFDAIVSAFPTDIQAFAICEIGAGVGLIFPPADFIEVHLILEGTLYLAVDEAEPIALRAGAMVVVPPGRQQQLAASPTPLIRKVSADVCIPARDAAVVPGASEAGKPVVRVACGTVRADPNGFYGPLDGLQHPIAEDMSDVPLVAAAFDAMLEEAASPSEGGMALTSALMKACLVLLLRRHLRSGARAGALPGLFRDPRLGRAIARIVERPSATYTVAGLAREAGMSRSAFAREFRDQLGQPPMEFVAGVRLDMARRLLMSTTQSIETIAAKVGFKSRSYFSQLFRSRYGTDPTSFRRQGAPPPSP